MSNTRPDAVEQHSLSTPLLDRIDSPQDLRQLGEEELLQLVQELRDFLLYTVSNCGGHFAASMGVAELTVALHYVFNTPDDRLVWDVGHQAYIHKILTGRKDLLHTIRQHNGLAPFPKRDESEYDTFGVGHSSTSAGAALGMSVAAHLQNNKRQCVAIIGDGGMTAGMAFEALNNAGDMHSDLLVILNDNNMSISPNVGALSNRWAQISTGKTWSKVRMQGKKVLSTHPEFSKLIKHAKGYAKSVMGAKGALFEEFGFKYTGPVDGHDLPVLLKTLRNLRNMEGPRFLHIITHKGKGYTLAEEDPVKYHGVTPFDPSIGMVSSAKKNTTPTYSQVFGDWLCDIAATDERVVGITPAMCEGSGMVRFANEFPKRYFDVAIAEQHSVTLAAGMACDGLRPVVAIYSTFLQRAYDQLIHDVVLQKLPVLFAIDRAGLVGADGCTHHGSYDIAFMRCLPNIILMCPADENECRQMLYTGYQSGQPAAVRYPRGKGCGAIVQKEMQSLPIGTAELHRQGERIALLAFGSMVDVAMHIAEELNATVINMRFVKPIDKKMLQDIAATHDLLISMEEHSIQGGAGSAVSEALTQLCITTPLIHCGLTDQIIEHGSREEVLQEAGLDVAGVTKFIHNHPAYRKFIG